MPGTEEVYRQVRPGVVTVVMVKGTTAVPGVPAASEASSTADGGDAGQGPAPKPRIRWITASMGSGILLDRSGHIATAAHVLEGADRIGVVFDGNVRVRARVIARDELTDLALLKVKKVPPIARPLRLEADSRLVVGQTVFAIGNPDGMTASLTAGLVSGLHRRSARHIRTFEDFVQTDAPLFPGCSGGPLVNRQGQVVALVTAVDRDKRGAGFAIPAHRALPILERLRSDKGLVRGWIGITSTDLDWPLEQKLGLGRGQGGLVRRVLEGYPAQRVGLRPGEVVLKAGGEPVQGRRDLAWAVALAEPGEPLELEVLGRGGVRKVEVVPVPRPEPLPQGGKNAF